MPEKRPPLNIAFCGDSLTEGFPGTAYFDLLQQKIPQHRLYNYGKGGDTVKSLHKRLRKTVWEVPFDILFLWIGVNDIWVKVSPLYPFIKRLRRQPWARNPDEFLQEYSRLLDFLIPQAGFLFTVSPLFIGEDLDNPWNQELGQLTDRIAVLSQQYRSISFINLRESFSLRLKNNGSLPFVPKKTIHILRDILNPPRKQPQEDSTRLRGLHYTQDGVHLNQVGAEIVAEVFSQKIQAQAEVISTA